MNCPSCAAPFQWFDRFAQLVVCQSCQATCVVDGASLELRGKMAALAPPDGVFSLGAMGTLKGKNFTVVGRVRYSYQRGFWDEWFLQFDDGSQRWVSEDEDRLQVSRLKKMPLAVDRFSSAQPGSYVAIGVETYHVNEKGVAECLGGEGQLPFVVEPGEKTPFLDISRGAKITGSVEFSESGKVRFYLGQLLKKSDVTILVQGKQYTSDAVEGASQQRFVQASADKPESYNCYGCGGALPATAVDTAVDCEYCGATNNPVQASCTCPQCHISVALPAGDGAASLSCPQCHTCFDPSGQVLGTQAGAYRPKRSPVLKVGTRGTIEGVEYVVTGWVFSSGNELGWSFTSWDYMLFNPDEGYRWLTHSEDHFSLARPIGAPSKEASVDFNMAPVGARIRHEGTTYKVSGHGASTVEWVEGQLPYVAKRGDKSSYRDAASAPYLLTMEKSADEVEYFLARYLHREEVARGFGLDTKELRKPDEKAPHQPYHLSQFRKQAFRTMLAFAFLNIVAIGWSNPGGIFVNRFEFDKTAWQGEVLSDAFTITQDDTIARVRVDTSVNNDWVYVDLGLLDAERRVIHEFGTTISYYYGVDRGESWREGDQAADFHMKIPKAGEYRLILKGDSKRYNSTIWLEVSEGCTLSGMNVFLLVLSLLWLLCELVAWMSFKGYIKNSDDD